MRFKKGDKVTLKVNKSWHMNGGIGAPSYYGPKFGEIVTVNHYYYPPEPDDFGWVNFDEYDRLNPFNGSPEYYNEERFERVISDSVLARELESVPEPFTI